MKLNRIFIIIMILLFAIILHTNDKLLKQKEENSKIIESSFKQIDILTEEVKSKELEIKNDKEKLYERAIKEQELIEPLLKLDKKEYLLKYKEILKDYSDYIDQPETIYDYTTDEEFDLLSKIVEAEIGNGDFNSKCNVASSIINRYLLETFPSGWNELLLQNSNGTYQYSSVGNGSYKNVEVSDDTIFAIEYAFMIEDTTDGCTYFHSERSNWHKNNLEFVFNDGYHSFYKLKESEE